MKAKSKKLNGDQPATQHDLAIWGGELMNRIEGVENRLEGMEERVANRVVSMMQAYNEQQMVEMNELHQDELDIVAGKKDAPPSWKSIPRRLKTAESEIETIKDRLAK